MQTYIGTKIVKMRPMTRAEYNDYRGWPLPADEDGSDEGYLVEYLDVWKPNVPGHDGYVSWSPKAPADNAYRPTSGMSFGLAVEALKKGLRVSRAGWNGKGMFLFLVPGSRFKVNRAPLLGIYPEGTEISYHAHIDMKTADGQVVPWLASQTDVLADDWMVS
ncbi:MAG: DUF2829 domain-containing protein [Telmatospirillum sp.]|nr:DUF2829 domain-containing protein [Telmatospirillum sp.]